MEGGDNTLGGVGLGGGLEPPPRPSLLKNLPIDRSWTPTMANQTKNCEAAPVKTIYSDSNWAGNMSHTACFRIKMIGFHCKYNMVHEPIYK